MAQHNEVLEGALNQLLTRRLAMQGGSPAPVLAPELLPVIVLEDAPPEYSYLKAERLWGTGAAVAADAANRGALRLVNPTGSGVLCIIEQVDASPESTSTILIQQHAVLTALGTLRSIARRDSRWGLDALTGAMNIPLVASFGPENTVNGLEVWRGRALASTNLRYQQPIVLAPGAAIDVQTNAVNIAVNLAIQGRIRAVVPGELLG